VKMEVLGDDVFPPSLRIVPVLLIDQLPSLHPTLELVVVSREAGNAGSIFSLLTSFLNLEESELVLSPVQLLCRKSTTCHHFPLQINASADELATKELHAQK